MICLLKTDGGKGNETMFWCGSDEVFAVEWRVFAGTLALQRSSQCKK